MSAAPHLVPFGPTWTTLEPAPEAGPEAAVWRLLTVLAALVGLAAREASPLVQIEALRLGHRVLAMAWRSWGTWEAEAAYQHGTTTFNVATLAVEMAAGDLRRAEAELLALEQQLVGDGPPRARRDIKPAKVRSGNVRPAVEASARTTTRSAS